MKKNAMTLGTLAALILIGAALWLLLPAALTGAEKEESKTGAPEAKPTTPEAKPNEELYPVNKHGFHTFYMRQMFTRYNEAKKYFAAGDMAMADANLAVLQLFADQVLNDKSQSNAQKPDAKEEKMTKENVAAVNDHAGKIRANLKDKKWDDTAAGDLDPMLKTCVQCHKEFGVAQDVVKVPTFHVCSLGSREVYELYILAGKYMAQGEWDKARVAVQVLKPYVDALADNVPDKNKNGEPIDKAAFLKAYQDTKRYNDDLLKSLTTKSFEGGKPLPPPHLLINTCYSCHNNVVKLPLPW